MKITMLMPNLALIGAQKMGLSFFENIHNENECNMIVLSDTINQLNELHYIPPYHVLKVYTHGIMSKIDTVLSIFKLRQYLKKTNPDVVISIAPIMNIYLLLATLKYGKNKPKIVIEEHQHLTQSLGFDLGSHHWIMRFYYNNFLSLYKTADVIKVVSQDSKKDFIESWNLPSEKLYVLNPPIHTAKIVSLSNEEIIEKVRTFVNQEDELIFSLGRLESQKNFELLIDVFYHAQLENKNLKLAIVGAGSQKIFLQSKIDSLDLQGKVLLAGYIENPYPIFKLAKLFCLTSVWEGMPVTIMESMVLGCPVVSVNCKSGPSEMIVDNFNGYITTYEQTEIARIINKVLADKENLEIMKKNCVKHAKKWDIQEYSRAFLNKLKGL